MGEQVLKSALELRGNKLVTATLMPFEVALTVYLVTWQKYGLSVGLYLIRLTCQNFPDVM